MRKLVLILLALAISAPAFAHSPDDEARIRAVIAEWYKRVAQLQAKAPWALMARNGIDAGPVYAEIPAIASEERSAAAYSGLHINNERAGKALRFTHEVDRLVLNANLARVDVREPGYFVCLDGADALRDGGGCNVRALKNSRTASGSSWRTRRPRRPSPPSKITSPMPDLRADDYAVCPT